MSIFIVKAEKVDRRGEGSTYTLLVADNPEAVSTWERDNEVYFSDAEPMRSYQGHDIDAVIVGDDIRVYMEEWDSGDEPDTLDDII